MEKNKIIEDINDEYLLVNQPKIVEELISAIKNNNPNFTPYVSFPKHYILSIYDPLELKYVLLGRKNLSINLNFKSQNVVNTKLLKFLGLIENKIDDIYDDNVIQLKREIEYLFLEKCLKEIEIRLGKKVQLYITQHITEISFDISKMEEINSEYLWENLEK